MQAARTSVREGLCDPSAAVLALALRPGRRVSHMTRGSVRVGVGSGVCSHSCGRGAHLVTYYEDTSSASVRFGSLNTDTRRAKSSS
jgi:hypothetical protein